MVTAPRRLGATDSKSRALLLDAAEQLMLGEGYAAVTSRRVASEAGVKPQLIHYYFRTMDDLFLEVYRRRAEASIERFARSLDERRTLRTIWQFAADLRGAAFNIEFVALGNHRKAIRDEIARYATQFRQMQLDAIAATLDDLGVSPETFPPVVEPRQCLPFDRRPGEIPHQRDNLKGICNGGGGAMACWGGFRL